MDLRLAIFDLDGTLYDTNVPNALAYAEALSPFGVQVTEEYFARHCNGRHYREFLPVLLGDKATPEAIAQVHREKKRIYTGLVSRARENRALLSLIAAPILYPLLLSIGSIGGEAWKE